MTSIAKPFRENTAVSVLFYTTSAKDTKIIFEDYAGKLMNDKKKELMTKLKSDKYSHVIFSLPHPYYIDLELPWKYFYLSIKMEMTDNKKDVFNDVRNILEIEPFSDSRHRERLAVLVASGKEKKMIGVSEDQVKKLTEQDVEKYFERYEALLSSKTCDAIVDTFLQLSFKALAHFLPIGKRKLLKDLNDKFMATRELGILASGLSLRYGEYMAITSVALLTVKNIEVPLVNDKEIDTFVKKLIKFLSST